MAKKELGHFLEQQQKGLWQKVANFSTIIMAYDETANNVNGCLDC